MKQIWIPLLLVLTWCEAGFSQEQYQITNLGTLGGTTSSAFGINDSGLVVGNSNNASGQVRGFLWQNGTMIDLGTLGGTNTNASDINNQGQVVGSSNHAGGGAGAAFLWQNGVMTDLGHLGGNSSTAVAINNLGHVAGFSNGANNEPRVFLWQGGPMIDLGTFGGIAGFAYGINDSVQVVGRFITSSGNVSAFLWQNGTTTNLGTLGGTTTFAYGINDFGDVVGYSTNSSGELRAFLWQNGTMTNLGTLGGTASFALAINNAGQAVGISTDSNFNSRAVLWQNNTLTDLNTLIDTGSGWILTRANAINNLGQIAGHGMINGVARAFLLTPQANTMVAWSNPAGGVFSDNTNWVGGAAPELGQSALFDSSYYATSAAGKTRITVTFDDLESTEGLTVTDADILLDLQSHSYGVDHLKVGGFSDSLSGSQLAIVNGVLGASAANAPVTIGGDNSKGLVVIGSNGFLEVSAPAGATLPTLLIGDDTCNSPDSLCGAIVVATGGTLFSAGAGLSNGVVNLRANSSWQDSRRVTVGETGKGYVQVVNAGLTTPELILGLGTGSRGEAYVKGGIIGLDKLTLGLQGTGSLTLDSAAICQVLGPVTIGQINAGDVFLRNSSMSVEDRFVIGDFGVGKLIIDSTSFVICNSAVLANNPGSVGRVLVSDRSATSGDSTQWRMQNHLFAGSFGKAIITVKEQGQIVVDSLLVLGEYESGLCSTFVSGVNSLLDVKGIAVIGLFGRGLIQIADTAIVRLRSGTSLGTVQSGLGDVLIRSYGRLEVSDSLFVGKNGRGGVALENGGQLTSEWAAVGGFAGAFGSARIDGAGSVWSNQGVLHAGAGGLALMRISDGGRLQNGGPLFVGPLGSLDATGGSFNSASLHVAGGGTFIDSAGVLQIGSAAAGKGMGSLATSVVDSLFLAQAAAFTVDSVVFAPGGYLGGSGSFPFDVVNDGGLNPGDGRATAGSFTAASNYSQTAGGTLFIELGGTVPGSGHDRLVVAGAAQLAGRLEVSAINGFEPQVGQTYEILTAGSLAGVFEEVAGQGGLEVDVIYNSTGVGITITSPLAIDQRDKPAENRGFPGAFSLGQNYPNPFNPETTVQFALPTAERVALTIYDLSGRKVKTLVAQPLPAGYHRYRWDGTTQDDLPVASGVYLYRLVAGGRFTQTRKMLLLR